MRVGQLLCCLGLCSGLLISCAPQGEQAASKSKGNTALPVREVRAARAQYQPMSLSVFAMGSLAAQERSVLSAKVPGKLQEIPVDVGTVVTTGMLLAKIEARDYELRLAQATAALAQARAALGLPPTGANDAVQLEDIPSVKEAVAVREEARKNLQRIQDLAKSGIAPQSELDKVNANFTVAQSKHDAAFEEARIRVATVALRRAELDLATKQLQDTAILAPFDGAVQSRRASPGEYLAPGAPIVEVVKSDPLRLRLEVPERAATLIKLQQPVRLWVESDTNTYSGIIARLSPSLDEQTRMLLVEADVPATGSLRAGLFARAEILAGENQQGLSVPAESIVTFAGIQKVVGVRDGLAIEKTVTTGRKGPGWVEITAGVQAGELIVLNPAGLTTGQSVRVLDSTSTAPMASTTTISNDAKTR